MTLGLIYVLQWLAGVGLNTRVIVHVLIAIRPEKLALPSPWISVQ